MRGYHEAPRHTATIFTTEPKDIVIQRWLQNHPGCAIESTLVKDGTVEIVYTKNAEVEKARLANEKPEVCIGTVDDHRRNSLSRGNRGIQL